MLCPLCLRFVSCVQVRSSLTSFQTASLDVNVSFASCVFVSYITYETNALAFLIHDVWDKFACMTHLSRTWRIRQIRMTQNIRYTLFCIICINLTRSSLSWLWNDDFMFRVVRSCFTSSLIAHLDMFGWFLIVLVPHYDSYTSVTFSFINVFHFFTVVCVVCVDLFRKRTSVLPVLLTKGEHSSVEDAGVLALYFDRTRLAPVWWRRVKGGILRWSLDLVHLSAS